MMNDRRRPVVACGAGALASAVPLLALAQQPSKVRQYMPRSLSLGRRCARDLL
jgi:hypothetical protein